MSNRTRTQSESASPPKLPANAARVFVSVAGQPATRREIVQPVTLVGSRRDCDLPLEHPDVSKLHAAIVYTGRHLLICDLSSRSGTFVADRLVRVAAPANGEAVRVGPVALEFEGLEHVEAHRETGRGDSQAVKLASPVRFALADGPVEITSRVAVIGRRGTCDIVLESPDVSLAHALVFVMDGRPAIFDLGSRSGTFLNGQRVVLAWINDDAPLRIGGIELNVSHTSATDETGLEDTMAAKRPKAEPRSADKQPPPMEPANFDLDELEKSISTLQETIASSQEMLDLRIAALDQRDARLAELGAEVEARRTAVKQAEADLTRQRADAADVTAAAEQLAEREAALERDRTASAELEARLAARASEIDVAREALVQEQAELERQRAEYESLQAELAKKSSELDAFAERLERESLQLESDRDGFTARSAEAEETRKRLDEQQESLDSERSVYEQQRTVFEQKSATADAQAEQLEERRTQLQSETDAVEKQRADYEERLAAFQKRERMCQLLEEALSARESEVVGREARLERFQQAEVAARRKIDQFKVALAEATTRFAAAAEQGSQAPASGIPVAAGQQPDAPEGADRSGAPDSERANAAVKSNGESASARRGSESHLPAPVVEEPMFDADPAELPADWPAEFRARFDAMRGADGKNDADLIAQINAELCVAAPSPAPGSKKGDKKPKRRWW